MKKYLLILLFVVTLLSSGVAVLAQEESAIEQPLSDEIIASNCKASQTRLKDVVKTLDRRARVDRLQAYRYISSRLDALVQRLEKNKQPYAAELREKLNNFDILTENFKNNYENYDQIRESLATLPECQANIEVFKAKLAETRTARALVASDVAGLNSLLGTDISGELQTLYQTLQVTGDSGSSL